MISKNARIPTLILLVTGMIFAIACSSGEVKDSSSEQSGYNMEQARSLFAEMTYAPHGQGFDYKVTSVDTEDFKQWLGAYQAKIVEALGKIGDGYVIQVTGHTDTIGPREKEGNKLGNVYYSTERAKNVLNTLKELGVPVEKMTYKGIADDEVLPNTEHRDKRNRRVTFKLVPVETPAEGNGADQQQPSDGN